MSSSRSESRMGTRFGNSSCRTLAIMLATLVGGLACAAPGDFDPEFGDSGRAIGRDMYGLDAVVLLDGGDLVLVGNDGDFLGDLGQNLVLEKVDANGKSLVSGVFADSGGYDDGAERAVATPDGKILVVGTTCCHPGGLNIAVYRFNADLSLDKSFGGTGYVLVDLGADEQGQAIAVEPDGTIVVAGQANRAQVNGFGGGEPLSIALVRLRPDGTQDPFPGAALSQQAPTDHVSVAALLRDSAGRFLLAMNRSGGQMNLGCRITRLTAQGMIDVTYAAGGTLNLGSPDGEPVECRDLALRDDGRLVVVGSAWFDRECDGLECSRAMVASLSADGQLDSTFNGGFADMPVVGTWNDLQRVQIDDDGNIVVIGLAWRDPKQEYCLISDVMVSRIGPEGTLDQTFGTSGISLLGGLPHARRPTRIAALLLDPVGHMFAGASYEDRSDSSTWSPDVGAGAVMRLLAHGAGPGIVEFDECGRDYEETAGQIAVTVRRTAGSAGPATTTYRTVAYTAKEGQDYVGTSGSLHWPAGDDSPRVIMVQLIDDQLKEDLEQFRLNLEEIEGSAPGVVLNRVWLGASDPAGVLPPPAVSPSGNGGGGAIDARTLFELSLLVLGLAWLRLPLRGRLD